MFTRGRIMFILCLSVWASVPLNSWADTYCYSLYYKYENLKNSQLKVEVTSKFKVNLTPEHATGERFLPLATAEASVKDYFRVTLLGLPNGAEGQDIHLAFLPFRHGEYTMWRYTASGKVVRDGDDVGLVIRKYDTHDFWVVQLTYAGKEASGQQ